MVSDAGAGVTSSDGFFVVSLFSMQPVIVIAINKIAIKRAI